MQGGIIDESPEKTTDFADYADCFQSKFRVIRAIRGFFQKIH